MRFGSLFSGIGGLDLGLERAGMECAWQVENDPYATRVLEKHWPNVARYGDIREVDFERVERVDIMAGGFPCQDLSYAGKGLGLSGARSGLWSEFKRAVRLVRPRFVLVENVPGLLSRGMGVVLGDLAALGYDAEWQVLPASAFGALHLRARVFVVAYAQQRGRDRLHEWSEPRHLETYAGGRSEDGSRGTATSDNSGRVQGQGTESRAGDVGYSHSAPTHPHAPAGSSWPAISKRGWWKTEPGVGRVAHGVPCQMDRLRGLGNAVVPQVAEYIGRLILEHERSAA